MTFPIMVLLFLSTHWTFTYLFFSKGAVIKYEADRGSRDSTGPPKMLREECWANKIFPTEKMGHEILI